MVVEPVREAYSVPLSSMKALRPCPESRMTRCVQHSSDMV